MASKKTILNVFLFSLILTLLLVLTGCGGGSSPADSVSGTGGGSGYGTGGGSGSSGGSGSGSGSGGGSGTTTKSVTLAWDAPTSDEDGSDLTDLAGYKLYYGTSPQPEIYATPVNVGAVITYTTPDLSPGTYYFVVTAYDTSGNESVPSNEVSTDVQ